MIFRFAVERWQADKNSAGLQEPSVIVLVQGASKEIDAARLLRNSGYLNFNDRIQWYKPLEENEVTEEMMEEYKLRPIKDAEISFPQELCGIRLYEQSYDDAERRKLAARSDTWRTISKPPPPQYRPRSSFMMRN